MLKLSMFILDSVDLRVITMMTIEATRMKIQRITDLLVIIAQPGVLQRDTALQNTTVPPGHRDAARESTVAPDLVQGDHMTHVRETTEVKGEIVTEIDQATAAVVSTRNETRKRRRRKDTEAQGQDLEMKRTNHSPTCWLARSVKWDRFALLVRIRNRPNRKMARIKIPPWPQAKRWQRNSSIQTLKSSRLSTNKHLSNSSTNSISKCPTIISSNNSILVPDRCPIMEQHLRARTQTTCTRTPKTHTSNRRLGRHGSSNNKQVVVVLVKMGVVSKLLQWPLVGEEGMARQLQLLGMLRTNSNSMWRILFRVGVWLHRRHRLLLKPRLHPLLPILGALKVHACTCTVQVKKSYLFRTVPSHRSEMEAVITLLYCAMRAPYRTAPIYRTTYHTVVLYYSGAHVLSNKRTLETVYSSAYHGRYGTVIRYGTVPTRHVHCTTLNKNGNFFFIRYCNYCVSCDYM